MKEDWKDISGYNGKYQISDKGRVKSFKNKKESILKFGKQTNGYLSISLWKNNKGKTYRIHRLVANAFISNPDNSKECNHKDGNKNNNTVKNIEWCSHKENMLHAKNNGLMIGPRGELSGKSKLTEFAVRVIRKLKNISNLTNKEIGNTFKVDESTISNIVNRKLWKHI